MDTRFQNITKPLTLPSNFFKITVAAVLLAVLAGSLTGLMLSKTKTKVPTQNAKVASQDTKTFRDFAEGTVKKKQVNDGEYTEGTHILERTGASPVALTSSVIDLAKYEGKKVKVYGETQKALSEGWLMDVGKVED